MDYKEKYEMALEGIQEILSSGEDSIKMSRLQLRLQGIFPELKEDEDERIRKAIGYAIGQSTHSDGTLINEVSSEEALAWLEKQGESKPADEVEPKDYNSIDPNFCKPIDKVEPKFKVGDWVVTNYGKVNQVIAVDEDGDGFTLDDDTYFSGSWKDTYHLWTIQDAKDGDILVYEGEIFMIKSYVLWNKIVYHCCYDRKILHMHNIYNSLEREDFDKVHPATKEQRDLLFQKMKEKGYEWDNEKKVLYKDLKKLQEKKLKKIEQNHICSDKNKYIIECLIDYLETELDTSVLDEDKETFTEQIKLLKLIKDKFL